jgi:uncharacterized protein (TIGR03437 family)
MRLDDVRSRFAHSLLGLIALRKNILFSLLLLTSAWTLDAQNFVNGQAARAVLGQYTFTFGGATPGPTLILPNQQIFGALSGLAWNNGTLYIADSNSIGSIPQDNRVLMLQTGLIPDVYADLTNAQSYSMYPCNVCAFPASNQLGQPALSAPQLGDDSDPNAFPQGLNNTSATSNMRTPTAVATDGRILAVADTDNNRVLIWNQIPSTLNQPADLVLGQPDFTHSSVNGAAATTLLGPQGVWIQDNKLFVADTGNNRILIWNSIPTSNGQPADIALGQPDLNSGAQVVCDPVRGNFKATANQVCSPTSVTSDGVHVFVADLGFNRVLIWNSIPTQMGQNADLVLGQPDMSGATAASANNSAVCMHGTGSTGVCDANLNFPRYALSDGRRLFVADGGNDRVLIWNTIPASNGVAADIVLGQPNTTTNNVTTQVATIASTAVANNSAVDIVPTPTSLAFDGTNLYVSDSLDNRVLVFSPGNTALPQNSAVNWASEIIRQEGVVSILANTINANDTVGVTLAGKTYTYTVKTGDTGDTIAQGLVALINADNGDPSAVAIFAGTNTSSLYLSSRGTNLGFDTIAFSATSSNTTNLVVTASGNGYLTAGTAGTGSPGMLVEINGSNLSDLPDTNPAVASLTGTIPTSLGGAQAFFDGLAQPIYSASASRVVAQIPYNFNYRNSTSIVVRTTHSDGSVTVTNATPIYIAPANPGIFNAPAQQGQARPWPATGVYHQSGNPQAVVDLTGSVKTGDVLTIGIAGARNYSYTVVDGDTLATVTANLAQAVNNGNDPAVGATVGGAFNRVVVVAKQGGAAGTGIGVTGTASSGASITLTAYTASTCCNVVSGSPITPTNPAAPGETINVSAAGLGIVDNLAGTKLGDIPIGQPYSGDVINSADASVSATLGSTTAQVVSAGLPQGSYGIYQVQLVIPEGQAANPATPLYIAQNAFISNTVTIPVGPANPNPNQPPVGTGTVVTNIDTPQSGSGQQSGEVPVAGWAISKSAAISSVDISVDGTAIGSANYGAPRADVCSRHSDYASCANGAVNVGFNYVLDTTRFADGSHSLQVTSADNNGNRSTTGTTFVTSNYSGALPTKIGMDNPGSNGGNFQGINTFSGWAVNSTSPITSVQVSVDGRLIGNATYGSPRPDVCAIYPSPSCQNGNAGLGWSYVFDTSTIANGNHVFAVNAIAQNGEHTIQAHSFTVANWTTANPIVANFDRPSTQNPILAGALNIGGWAVDPLSAINSAFVSVDGIPLGDAGYGGNRADVCAIYPTPGCPRVGWSYYLDTTLLSDGAHVLQVTFNPVSGLAYTATTPFQVSNQGSVFNSNRVSIDTPNQASAPVNGFTAIGGWALNTKSAVSTVEVLVDGTTSGYASYGGNRSDVCGKLSSPGCPNVGWNYLLDTSRFTNGVHALQIRVVSENGERAGASTSFTVSNTAGSSPTVAAISQPSSQSSPYQGMALFSGTASSTSATVNSIAISVDGYPYGQASYTPAGANNSIPWTFSLNTAQFADGVHTLGVTAVATDGTYSITSASFTVANWTSPSPTRVVIDTPNAGSAAFTGVSNIGGWALNPVAPITAINIAVDNIPIGSANYGGDRSDACRANASAPGCPNVGWNAAIDSTVLANGQHSIAVTATTVTGQSTTVTSSFSVNN